MRYLIALALAGAPTVALAQGNCAERDSVVDRLEAGYGEEFTGGGLQNARRIIEVWASEEQGTWTILMTTADGKSCVMASGTDWRKGLPEAKGIPG
jgi:hypothetical protein